MSAESESRIAYIDYLRVFAALAVVMLHIGAQNWDHAPIGSFSWEVFNFFDGITRWTVPVFVMISGALFLGRDISIKTLYSKYVLRLMTAFAFWSVLYALFSKEDLRGKIWEALTGHYHLWFVLMLIGIYICIPLLRMIVKNPVTMKYFLVLATLFTVVLTTVSYLTYDFGGDLLNSVIRYVNTMVDSLNLHMVIGYTVYFVLGYALSLAVLKKKLRIWIYIAGLAGLILTVVLTSVLVRRTQDLFITMFFNESLLILLTSMAIFTWFQYHKFNGKHFSLIRKLSKYSFGVYLVHPLIMDLLRGIFGFHTLSMPALISVPLLWLIVTILSFLISAGLNQIPFVNKYFV